MSVNDLTNTTIGWWQGKDSGGFAGTISVAPPTPLYLIDCIHCNSQFVTKPRKSMACIQSMETCWDVECPKCGEEIRLCLHECKHDCEHVLDCILVGICDDVVGRAIQLEFEKGAAIHQYQPYGVPLEYPWNAPVIGNPNVTWGGTASPNYTVTPYTTTTITSNTSLTDNSTMTISFQDKLRSFLKSKLENDPMDDIPDRPKDVNT